MQPASCTWFAIKPVSQKYGASMHHFSSDYVAEVSNESAWNQLRGKALL